MHASLLQEAEDDDDVAAFVNAARNRRSLLIRALALATLARCLQARGSTIINSLSSVSGNSIHINLSLGALVQSVC